MDPNQPYTPQPQPQQQPMYEPPAQPVPPVVPVKRKNTVVPKVLVGALIVVIATGGVGAYLWRDAAATRQKNDDAAKITQLETEVVTLNKKVDQLSSASDVGGLFSSITAKSNTTKAQTNASTVQKIAEAYNADMGYYPRTTADFSSSDSAKLPVGVAVSAAAPNASNGTTTTRWEYTGVASAPTGGRVTYWDYTTSAVSSSVVYTGTASAESVFISPKS